MSISRPQPTDPCIQGGHFLMFLIANVPINLVQEHDERVSPSHCLQPHAAANVLFAGPIYFDGIVGDG
jgi:hypothetical protein